MKVLFSGMQHSKSWLLLMALLYPCVSLAAGGSDSTGIRPANGVGGTVTVTASSANTTAQVNFVTANAMFIPGGPSGGWLSTCAQRTLIAKGLQTMNAMMGVPWSGTLCTAVGTPANCGASGYPAVGQPIWKSGSDTYIPLYQQACGGWSSFNLSGSVSGATGVGGNTSMATMSMLKNVSVVTVNNVASSETLTMTKQITLNGWGVDTCTGTFTLPVSPTTPGANNNYYVDCCASTNPANKTVKSTYTLNQSGIGTNNPTDGYIVISNTPVYCP